MKKLCVILLCLIAGFAVVSCKNEPQKQGENQEEEIDTTPKPTDEDVLAGKAYYRLTATTQAKRFSFLYEALEPKAGDVLTITYRSEHPVTMLYLRDGDEKIKFLYKYEILESEDPYVSAPDADGWITMTFTYPEAPAEGAYDAGEGTVPGIKVELANYDQKFQVDEYLEIKEFTFNGEKLAIDGPETIKEAEAGFKSDHGVWNRADNTDQTDPVLERIFFASETNDAE